MARKLLYASSTRVMTKALLANLPEGSLMLPLNIAARWTLFLIFKRNVAPRRKAREQILEPLSAYSARSVKARSAFFH